MMDDLIRRQEAIDEFMKSTADGDKFEWCNMVLKQVPSAQRTGRWIRIGRRLFKCDQCKKILDFNGVNAGRGSANYCPNCGARMEVEE